MWKSLPSVAAAAAFLLAPVLYASDIVYPGGGTLTQIVDGGGTNTIITLANLDTVSAPYTLNFYDDNGSPLTLSTTAGTGSSLSGALAAHSSTIIQTNGGGSTILQGYAVLVTGQFSESSVTGAVTAIGNQIAGSAVFGIPLVSGIFAQASCPLDTGQDYIFILPFDETGDAASAQTGVALANSVADGAAQTNGPGQTAYVNVSVYDNNGNLLPVPAGEVPVEILPYGGHESFLLDQKYPQVIGTKGTVVFTGGDAGSNPYIIKVLGLRATNNTYTSITPIVPCNPQVYSNGQYAGCSN
jgi:hypothetical protein